MAALAALAAAADAAAVEGVQAEVEGLGEEANAVPLPPSQWPL